MDMTFIRIDIRQRAHGHSVAAALAYRTGLSLRKERPGALHDYRPRETREEIANCAIVSSRATPLPELDPPTDHD